MASKTEASKEPAILVGNEHPDSFWSQQATLFVVKGPRPTPSTRQITETSVSAGTLAEMVAKALSVAPPDRWRYSIVTEQYPSFHEGEIEEVSSRADYPFRKHQLTN